MKKVLLFFSTFLVASLSLANEGYQVEKFGMSCERIKNNIESLKQFKDSIISKASNVFTQETNGQEILNLQAKNDSVFKWSSEIIELSKKRFDAQPNDTFPKLAVQTVDECCQEYFKAISKNVQTIKELTNESIEIDTYSIHVLDSCHQVLLDIKNNFTGDVSKANEVTTSEQAAETESTNGKDYLVYIILGVLVLCILFLVFVIISLKQLGKTLQSQRKRLKGVYDRLEVIESWHEKQKQQQDNNKNAPKKNGTTSATPNPCTVDVQKLEKRLSRLEQKMTAMSTKNERSLFDELNSDTEPNTTQEVRPTEKPQVPDNKLPSKPKAKPLYAQVQNNGNFKVYEDDKQQAFFVITPDEPGAGTGTFTLKELNAETKREAIDNRNGYLGPACDIESISGNAMDIKVIEPGKVVRTGNDWRVSKKAKIALV